jgi:hypothetical protein
MKKLLFSAALALLACGVSATPSFAHAFGLFTCHKCCGHHCGKCCSMKICCQQYNAFTPFCCGNICCNGCCPFGGGGGPGPGPAPYGPLACGPDGCSGGELPAGGLPPGALPAAPATGPALQSKPLPSATSTSMYQPAYAPVQSAGYYPGYAYGYNNGYGYGPASGYGPMVAPAFNPLAVPAYWNSDR